MNYLQQLLQRVNDLARSVGDALQLRGFKSGGSAGQVPVKNSGTDFDWSWGDVAGSGASSWDDLTGSANHIPLNTSPTDVPTTEGTASWSTDDHTLNIQTDIAEVIQQVGQEQFIRVKNDTGSTIANGKVVYLSGASGQRPTVALASVSNTTHVKSTIGVATHDIGTSPGFGYVTTIGLVRDVNTFGLTEGAPLYLGESGAWTTTIPTSGPVVRIGWVVVAGNNGTIFVHIERLSIIATQISDSTAAGRALITAADAPAQLVALGGGATGVALFKAATVNDVRIAMGGHKSMVPLETDFCNGAATGFFTSAAVGSGSTVSGTEANHPGTLWLSHLAGNANSGWRITSDGNCIMLHAGLLGEFIFKSTEGFRTTSFSRLGFHDSTGTSAVVDGAWIELVGNGTVVTLFGKTSNNSSSSTTGTQYTLPLNTWVRGSVSVESASLVRFSLYSETGDQLWTDTLATNIPTAAGRACGFGVVSFDTSATATTFYMIAMDYMRVSSSATFNR